jgi:hypothetical protein
VSRPDLLQQLNRILERFIHFRAHNADSSASRLDDNEAGGPVSSEEVQELESALDNLIDLIPGLQGTVSRDLIREELLPRLQRARAAGVTFTSHDADSFKQALCGLPIQRLRVVRRLYGVDASPENTPVQLGQFTIDFGGAIFGPFKEHPIVSFTSRPEDAQQLFIECAVEARDGRLAISLADRLFYRLELIFRVFLGISPIQFEVGVLNYVGPQMCGQMVLSATGPLRQASSWEGALQPFILNDPRFPMPTGAFARLFSLITTNTTEFEKHVLRCAEWTGQAIAESNPASALVKAAIALEVMFSIQEKGVIAASFMAQIAESRAFILGTDKNSRIKVEHEIKRLYGVRSAVVHSGKDSVNEEDLHSFIRICRSIVVQLLSKDDFSKITSMTELASYLKNRKYSSC